MDGANETFRAPRFFSDVFVGGIVRRSVVRVFWLAMTRS